MSNHMEIARTISSQIGKRALWALGAQRLIAVAGGADHLGGLTFKASLFGRKKCWVTVTLNAKDLYNIDILTERSRNTISQAKDIFCEELSGEVEMMVERWFQS